MPASASAESLYELPRLQWACDYKKISHESCWRWWWHRRALCVCTNKTHTVSLNRLLPSLWGSFKQALLQISRWIWLFWAIARFQRQPCVFSSLPLHQSEIKMLRIHTSPDSFFMSVCVQTAMQYNFYLTPRITLVSCHYQWTGLTRSGPSFISDHNKILSSSTYIQVLSSS